MKSSRFQIPNSKESPNSKFQSAALPALRFGSWKFHGTWNVDFGALLACAACYGKSDSPLASGMNAGIFTLLGVVLTVLTCAALFFVHVIRGEARVLDEKSTPTPDSTQQTPTDK